MKVNTNPVKGTRDFLPSDVELRDYVRNTILEVYKKHGFSRIETPALENSNILLGSEGGENLKLIYKILKRGEKLKLDTPNIKENDLVDMGLRYDLTLPLSRFYANNQANLPREFKSIQIGEVYRAERPQKGRYRAFVQCDIDIIGDKTYAAELDLISTTSEALTKIGFDNFKIRINDRRILKGMIESAGFNSEDVPSVCITLDKVDKIGIQGVEKELSENGYDKEIVEKFLDILTRVSDLTYNLNELGEFGVQSEVIESINTVISVVSNQTGDFEVVFDPSLVRGMGYYTGMIFEIEYKDFGISIAGGGRYDEMIGRFMKESVPAVGFSIGFERIIAILQDKEFKLPRKDEKVALLFDLANDDIIKVYETADQMRGNSQIVSVIQKQKKLGKQIDRLALEGFSAFAIYNDEEVKLKNI